MVLDTCMRSQPKVHFEGATISLNDVVMYDGGCQALMTSSILEHGGSFFLQEQRLQLQKVLHPGASEWILDGSTVVLELRRAPTFPFMWTTDNFPRVLVLHSTRMDREWASE